MFQMTNAQIKARVNDEANKLKALIEVGHERGVAMDWFTAHGQINDIWFDRFGNDYGCADFIRQSIDEIHKIQDAGLIPEYAANCAYGMLVQMYKSTNFLQHCRKFGF